MLRPIRKPVFIYVFVSVYVGNALQLGVASWSFGLIIVHAGILITTVIVVSTGVVAIRTVRRAGLATIVSLLIVEQGRQLATTGVDEPVRDLVYQLLTFVRRLAPSSMTYSFADQ